ncbi:hypothetical protein MAR_004968 [Mya arenaria]|uniref:Reverse transcriptase domain-containing protein n=1 Tax=Mya arenaria TaxID=6604 RepID=A0ABY7EY46_MYAAR|nr:hypothetical protein MAR_004968 [Mya arenaria]
MFISGGMYNLIDKVGLSIQPWEKEIQLPFDPYAVSPRSVSYVNLHGDTVPWCNRVLSVEEISTQNCLPDLSSIQFQNHKQFVSGQLHTKTYEWENIILKNNGHEETLRWIKHGVDISDFFTQFKGKFWGVNYDCALPPPMQFKNANKCKKFTEFINSTIQERLENGSIECLGKVGVCQPPHIVAPLTVEPLKPRLCLNLMYLNNWIKNISFSLDTLKDIPRAVKKGAYFTSLDDKSGFDNVRLNENSYKYVGFQWAGYYFYFKTLVFGFKLSSYIYHTLNLQVASYIRREFSIPIFLYIDDRLIEQVRRDSRFSDREQAIVANYITCEILTRLGYCINLDKSCFQPSQRAVLLGFIVDSEKCCFRVTEVKKQKFIAHREFILSKRVISLLDLQKLSGKAISFMLAVPAARLYIREMNAGISRGLKGGQIYVTGSLREEIEYWRFLDNWKGKVVWKPEHLEGDCTQVSDFWDESLRGKPIMILEGLALIKVLRAVRLRIASHRVDAKIDNKVLLHAWVNQGCKSHEMNLVIKDLFQLTIDYDIILNMQYVPSKSNPADEPSRSLNKTDSMLSKTSWQLVEQYYGGHAGHILDLMSLDSNCMRNKRGGTLRHFTPWPTHFSSGVNMFAQVITPSENCYVFPPFSLILTTLRFLIESKLTGSLVLPLSDVTPYWFPEILQFVPDAFVLGYKDDTGILQVPSKSGFVPDLLGLVEDLWVIRVSSTRGGHDMGQSWGKMVLTGFSRNSRNNHFVCVGDSMIRFLLTESKLHCPMTHVFSISGGLIRQMIDHLFRLVNNFPPRVVFVHVGVNNLSKEHLYKNEFEQMTVAGCELDLLESSLLSIKQSNKLIHIIVSSVIITRNSFINARAELMNDKLQNMCGKHGWLYLNNCYLGKEHLKDAVHLNKTGEILFVNKLFHLQNCIVQ